MKNKILTLLILITAAACDKIEVNDIEKKQTPITITTNKNIYLEYFTGHKCVNCPSQTSPAFKQIKELYGNQVIIVSIHEGFFALPFSGAWSLDLRSNEGKSIYDQFKITAVPTGMINRLDSKLITPSGWTSVIAEELKKESPLNITIEKDSSNSTSGILNIEYNFVSTYSGVLKSYVYITEDSIIGLQSDSRIQGGVDSSYTFNHVLRTALPDSDATIGNGSFSKDESIKKAYTYEFNPLWITKSLNAVVIVCEENGNVIQVNTFEEF